MRVEKDYEELLGLFNKNKVNYCIVGAFAMALYAKPRFTKDMDILVEPSIENSGRIIKSLRQFGFKDIKLSEKDFSKEGTIIQLGYEPIRVDILTSIEGCSFEEAWKNRKVSFYGKQKAFFIGLNQLIKNKAVTKRKQDKADLEILLKAKKR